MDPVIVQIVFYAGKLFALDADGKMYEMISRVETETGEIEIDFKQINLTFS